VTRAEIAHALEIVRHDSVLGRWELVSWRPTGPLAAAVECVWAVDGRAAYSVERMFPRPTVEVLFNLGPSHRLLDPTSPHGGIDFRRAWVAGLQKDCLTVESRDATRILGLRLRPAGAFAFFGAPLGELSGRVVDLDLVLGPWIETVRQRLLEAKSWAERFAVVAALVHRRLGDGRAPSAGVAFGLQALARSRGSVRMRALSKALGLGEDAFTRVFRREVGLTPKRYARILRFQGVLEDVGSGASVDWTRLAQDLGYFDQAHFIKDFRSFTGTTPTEYMAHRTADGDALVEG
jgi:AraC-like DNA-binding protein